MKKGKVFGKGQITVAVMLLALGSAIWLNTKYLPSDTKYLGEASYVNGSAKDEAAVETSAKAEKEDNYFEKAKKEREEAYKKAEETVEELLDNKYISAEEKAAALKTVETLGANIKKENNIETLLKAKGFKDAVAVIGEKGISVIVKSEGLTSAQTLQIQDIVTNETQIELGNIKIIPITE